MRRSPTAMGPDAAGPVERGHTKEDGVGGGAVFALPAPQASLMRPT
jgi:hypothetical protein